MSICLEPLDKAMRHALGTGSLSEDQARDLRITQGRAAKLTFQVSDPFGAFPLDLKAILTSPPAEWWWKPQKGERGQLDLEIAQSIELVGKPEDDQLENGSA